MFHLFQVPVLVLIVGGCIFLTERSNVLQYPNSHLAELVENPTLRDESGNIFIHRNSRYFEYILDFLRDNNNFPPRKIYTEVLKECMFYGINDLERFLKQEAEDDANNNPCKDVDFYRSIKKLIIENGPRFLLEIGIHTKEFYNLHMFKEMTDYVTGSSNVAIKTVKEANCLVSWLWRDIRSAGFGVAVQFDPEAGTTHENGVNYYYMKKLKCLFILK